MFFGGMVPRNNGVAPATHLQGIVAWLEYSLVWNTKTKAVRDDSLNAFGALGTRYVHGGSDRTRGN